MIALDELLKRLGYDESPYYRSTEGLLEPETAHLFRAARTTGVQGIYVFEASPGTTQKLLSERPAVYVAEATNEAEARSIHRKLWNLGYAPFFIICLPDQIRIYTGFDYSESSESRGLLVQAERLNQLNDVLYDFRAASIDTGQIWKSPYARELNPNQRVNKRLLRNLEALGKALKVHGLRDEVAHALIGKYVYFSYLRDRNILHDWLVQQGIDLHSIFHVEVTVADLRMLVETLEYRFNGQIFPIDFDRENTLEDKHVSWVASVFTGAEMVGTASDMPDVVRQLHLPFQAYDFQYIPVEMLSAIYEQFIYERKAKGAVYTPETLADYLLSEVEWARPLARGMRILDPACGSGVFLVLAYRRLIEKEMQHRGRKLTPRELRELLLESIYGVERERDACYVAEFSLLLTLLHYSATDDLQDLQFQLPKLHNRQIFECDFFDVEAQKGKTGFWQQGLDFDWIVGNPPWIELKQATSGEEFARAWIQDPKNSLEYPIGGNRVAEAFSWLVTKLLNDQGVVGLILPATSLFSDRSEKYRQRFFSKQEVLRITNFANLREVLFDRRSEAPAMTLVYRKAADRYEKPPITHYAPFMINQLFDARYQPWVITVHANEVQSISPYEAEEGEASLWKFALWGTYHDRQATERIRYVFTYTLKDICRRRVWSFHRDVELRDGRKPSRSTLTYIPELKGKRQLQADLMRQSFIRFSIPVHVLKEIPDEMCYIRDRGGKEGLKVIQAPHIILSPSWMSYIVYSDEDFVIPPKHMGLASSAEDASMLRALSIYLSSSLVAYYLFFHASEWGIFRRARWVSISEVGAIPTPEFTPEQTQALAALQEDLARVEKQKVAAFLAGLRSGRQATSASEHSTPAGDDPFSIHPDITTEEKKAVARFASDLRAELQAKVDQHIFDLFKIPDDTRYLISEFVQIRLQLDKRATMARALRKPTPQELLVYAQQLRAELDDFAMGTMYHRISMTYSEQLIECVVEMSEDRFAIPVSEDNREIT